MTTIKINGTSVNVLIFNTQGEVLDETLDSASLSYIDSNPLPIAPMQRVEVKREDNISVFFVTISDSVEPYTPTSGLYKHEVTCAESTRILSKRVLRNSVFSQPPYPRKGKTTLTALADVEIVTHERYRFSKMANVRDNGFVSTKLTVPSNEKCSRAYVKLTTQFFFGAINDTNYNTTGKVKMFKNSLEFANFQSDRTELLNEGKARLYWTLNGVDDDDEITFDTSIYNGEFDSPRIKELINQGATDIYIKTTTARPLYYAGVDGFLDPNDPDGFENHLLGWNVCFEIIAETYIHTAYSILQEIKNRIEQKRRVRRVYSNSTTWENFTRDSLFLLPESGSLYNLLNNTIAPNMTFTQCSVYEAVAEVFRLFDAIFTMDENGTLGITYFNEKTGTANPSIIAKNSAIGEERFINGLMCYYQDARVKTSFPIGKQIYAPVSSVGIGVVPDEDKVFRTPSPIHDVISFKQLCSISLYNGSVGFMKVSDFEVDMTERVYEKSIWSATLDVSTLPASYDSNDFSHQADSIYFTQGEKYVDISNSFTDVFNHFQRNIINASIASLVMQTGVTTIDGNSAEPSLYPNGQNDPSQYDWSLPRFKIEYNSSSNGVFKVESYSNKYDGEMPIDQASGSIDLGKAGLNILGLSFRMGEPTLNVTHRATSWEDRIQKGFVLTYQGEQWTANNCRYTCIAEDTYQGQISFVKNYNELSLNKKVLREKRLSSVSDELTTKSEEIITDYCYVFESQTDLNNHLDIVASCWDLSAFGKAMSNSFGNTTTLQTLNDVSLYQADNGTAKRFFLPSHRYGAGDLICFEMSYDDPMAVGIKFSVTSGWFGANEYFSRYVIYTDAQGYLEKPNITLQTNDVEAYSLGFPALSAITPSGWAFNISQYRVNKQPNEVFAINFQTAFIPFHPKKVIIGKSFIEDNFFVNGVMKERALRFYYSDTEEYSVLDTKARGTLVNEAQNVVYQAYNQYFSLAFGGSPMVGHKSWAVCDENDNILIACNSSDNVLYFTLRVSRI